MYNIDRTNIKKGISFYMLFFVVGLIFLLVFGFIFISPMIKKNSYDKSVLANEIELIEHRDDDGMTYSPKYYFNYNGIQYFCNSNSSSSIVDTNKKLVYFDSNNPSDCLTEFDANPSILFLFIAIGIPGLFISIAVYEFVKIRKILKRCDHLEKFGVLYRNLPYRMESTNISKNNVKIMKIVVDFTLPNGSVVTLHGNPRHDGKNNDEDGLVDVLMDPNDDSNYFVDFNIGQK